MPRSSSPSTGCGQNSNVAGVWCEHCNTRLIEMKRQALRLMSPKILNGTLPAKDNELSATLHEKLQVPDTSQKWTDNRCEVCATHLNQLKQEAVAMVHSLEKAHSSGDTSSLNNIPALVGSRNLSSLQRCLYMYHSHDKSSAAHSRPRQTKGVFGNAMSSMKLAAQAQQYLEGDGHSGLPVPMQPASAWNNPPTSAFPPHHPASHSSAGSSKSSALSDASSSRPNQQYGMLALTNVSKSSPMSSNASTVSNTSAAASFFARAAQKLNLTSKKKKKQTYPQEPVNPEPPVFPTNFGDCLLKNSPPAPPCLLRSGRRENPGMGKVKVMLRICPSPHHYEGGSFLSLDPKKKQVTIYDPAFLNNGYMTPAHRRAGVMAPKMFAFDAIFSQDAAQAEICAGSVADIVQSVVNGADGCLFCYGHARLGKTYTMIGKDDHPQNLGIIPCAISWLFKLINDRKERSGARFSVRVSAVEVVGKSENLKDLLAEQAMGSANGVGTSPGIYLRDDPICGVQLHNQSELRAPTPEKAAFYLDAALAARCQPMSDGDPDEDAKTSHMLFTLHIYQYRVDKSGKGGVAGGRSRLHLIDLGSCGKLGKTNSTGSSLSLSALGNVILALVNGAKHIPFKESKLTQLLRDSLGNLSCRTTMIAHVSAGMSFYSEALSTVQMASRIHRMRKKKSKYSSTSSSGGDSSCDEGRIRHPRIRALHPRNPPMLVPEDATVTDALHYSDNEYISSSEQSCDTVIYCGPNGAALSDRELTDNEGPPAVVPIVRSPVSKVPAFNRTHARSAGNSPEIRRKNSGARGSDGESGKKQLGCRSAENSPEIRRKNTAPVPPPPPDAPVLCEFGPETARKVDTPPGGLPRMMFCEFGPETARKGDSVNTEENLPFVCDFGPQTARRLDSMNCTAAENRRILCEFGPETARRMEFEKNVNTKNYSNLPRMKEQKNKQVDKKTTGIPTPVHSLLPTPKARNSPSTSPERSHSPARGKSAAKSIKTTQSKSTTDKQSYIPTSKMSSTKQRGPPPVKPKPLVKTGNLPNKFERTEPQGGTFEDITVIDCAKLNMNEALCQKLASMKNESIYDTSSISEVSSVHSECYRDFENELEERTEPAGMSATNEQINVKECYFVPIPRNEAQDQSGLFEQYMSDRPEVGCRPEFDVLDNQPNVKLYGDSTMSLEVNAPDVSDKQIDNLDDDYDINDEEIEMCMWQAENNGELSTSNVLPFSQFGNSVEIIGTETDAEDQISPSEAPMVDLLTKTLDQMMANNNMTDFTSSELPLSPESDITDTASYRFEDNAQSVSHASFDDEDDTESIGPSLIPDEPSSSMYLSVNMFKKQLWDRCNPDALDQEDADDAQLDRSDSDDDHPLRPLSMLSVDSDNTFTTSGRYSRPDSLMSANDQYKIFTGEERNQRCKPVCITREPETILNSVVPVKNEQIKETCEVVKDTSDEKTNYQERRRISESIWKRRESYTEEELQRLGINELDDMSDDQSSPQPQSPMNGYNTTDSGIPTLRSLISKGGVTKPAACVRDNCIPGSFKFASPPTSPSKRYLSTTQDGVISVHPKIAPQTTSEILSGDEGSTTSNTREPMPDLLMGSPKRDPSPSKMQLIPMVEKTSMQQSVWRKETRLWHVEGKSDPDISDMKDDVLVPPLIPTTIGMVAPPKYSPILSDSEEPPCWLSRQPDGACDPPEVVKETTLSPMCNKKFSHVVRRKDLNGKPDGYASDSCCRLMKTPQSPTRTISPSYSVCSCCSNREDINGNIQEIHRLAAKWEKTYNSSRKMPTAKTALTSKNIKPVVPPKPGGGSNRPNVSPKPKPSVKPKTHSKHNTPPGHQSLADVVHKLPPRRHNLETSSLRSASSASSRTSSKLPIRSASTTAVNLLSNAGSSKLKNSKLPPPSSKLTKNSSTTSSKSSMQSVRSVASSKSNMTNKSQTSSIKTMQNASSKTSKTTSSGKSSTGTSKIPQSTASKSSNSLSSSSKAVSKSAPSLAKSSSAKLQQSSNIKANKSVLESSALSANKSNQSIRHTDSDSGNDSGIAGAESTPSKNKSRLLSPYSTVTKPRMASRCSSGHGSDNSSTISDTLGFTASKIASPCTGGTSSGYESMLRDSEATASTSSTHDSLSESSAGRVKGVKMLKKKLSQGSRSRRSGPPRPTDSPSAVRKTSPGRWLDIRPKSPKSEPVELKVYEVDEVPRRRNEDGEKSSDMSSEDDDEEEEMEDEYFEDEEGNDVDDEDDEIQCDDEEENMAYFNAKLVAIERRQETVATLRYKQQQLKEELSATKAKLMVDSSQWNFNLNVFEDIDSDTPNFVESFQEETDQLEQRLAVCKSHVMMVTCFDVNQH
ncbi:uncharacterized protein LOC100377557 [Saccoglossus kowalevskii]